MIAFLSENPDLYKWVKKGTIGGVTPTYYFIVWSRAVSTVHEWLSLLSDTLKSLLNLTSVLQSEGAASATATHSQIQNPVWNVNIGNGCSLNSKMLLQIQQTFECV